MLECFTELIDKCVGSRIWVVMKGEKGKIISSHVPLLEIFPLYICPSEREKRKESTLAIATTDSFVPTRICRHFTGIR